MSTSAFLRSLATGLIFCSPFLYSCEGKEQQYTEEIRLMEDTLFKSFPTVNRVSIEVKQDFGSELRITLGDEQLYNGPETGRTDVVSRTADITKHVFTSDKMPEKGKLIFVKEENTIKTDEATWKTYDIPLPSGK
ncbi:MAG: hypothetical protein EOP49_18205 [Sphingobacteriales bacterium]|nr:MAG: hypothetical protein EOP49_18205 [Sphingobacteriales bacterium]